MSALQVSVWICERRNSMIWYLWLQQNCPLKALCMLKRSSSSIEVPLHMFLTPTSILDWTGYCLMQSKGCDLRHDRPKISTFFSWIYPLRRTVYFLMKSIQLKQLFLTYIWHLVFWHMTSKVISFLLLSLQHISINLDAKRQKNTKKYLLESYFIIIYW